MGQLTFCLLTVFLSAQEPEKEKKLSFHFKDASVDAVLKYVSSVTGWIFVQEKQVAGSITAVSDTEVPASRCLDFLNAALRPVDAIISNPVAPDVPKPGQVLKVQDLGEVMRRQLKIFQGSDPEVIPATSDIRTQIVPLKAMNVAEVQKELGELLKKVLEADGQVAVSTYSNALILTGRSDCIRNAVRVLRLIDVSTSSELRMQTFTLKNADAGEVVRTLNEIYNPGEAQKAQQAMYAMQMGQQQKAAPTRPLSKDTIRVVAETQTNSVIIIANEDNLADIRKMIERLDQRGSATVKVKFYALRHADALAVAKFVTDLFSESGGGSGKPSSSKSRGQLFVYDMYGRMVPHNDSSGSALEVRVVADPRANKLVVAASEQRLIMIDAIVEELDQPISDLIQLRIYKLRHASAKDTAAILKDLFLAQVKATQGGGQKAPQQQQPQPQPGFPPQPQPKQAENPALLPSQEMEITADERTSRVLVRASKEYLAIMDQVVAELDADPTASMSTYVVQLRNGDAATLATMLQNLMRGTPSASQIQAP
ncbi:MAG TPA: secretin N-terminal domain-containing protein, partial [Planctomycetota bacterium]|nr:secretin N-terminal domain-containing protein [Planctomycetota bacterium]